YVATTTLRRGGTVSLPGLLQQLSERGIKIWFEGPSLRFRAPSGTLDASLRSELTTHKEALRRLTAIPEEKTEGIHEALEERTGIREYCGKQTTTEAQTGAFSDVFQVKTEPLSQEEFYSIVELFRMLRQWQGEVVVDSRTPTVMA